MTAPTAQSPTAICVRCIVWHTPDRSPARALLDALAKRGLRASMVQSAFGAMAAACAEKRDGERSVLLLVEPQTLAERDHVCAALERYAPNTVVWVYEGGAEVPLRAMEAPVERADEESVLHHPQQARPAQGVPLRLTEPLGGARPATESEGADRLLSDEELSMLLDDSPHGR